MATHTSVRLPALAGGSLTKAESTEALYDQLGLNKREAKNLVDAFFALLYDDIVNSGDVKLAGFGRFTIRRKEARPGRNPRTGAAVVIAARQVVAFRPSPISNRWLKAVTGQQTIPTDAPMSEARGF